MYLTLPDVRALKHKNPTLTAFMALREQEYRAAEGRAPKRRQTWVPLKRISPNLIHAVLLTEDAGFYQHDGVDYRELWESMKLNWRDRKLRRGGSTITQQLAKNLYLSPERSFARKFRELLIARRLEQELSKRRILELYLNVVEWGRHLYGAEEAARRYFGVSAHDLDPAQAATLAGMLINPIKYNPDAAPPRLARRQRIILDRMVRFGRITRQEYRVALGLQPAERETEPVPAIGTEPPDDGLAQDEPAPEPPPAAVGPIELSEPAAEDVLVPELVPVPPAGPDNAPPPAPADG